jgi:hypothetical protein
MTRAKCQSARSGFVSQSDISRVSSNVRNISFFFGHISRKYVLTVSVISRIKPNLKEVEVYGWYVVLINCNSEKEVKNNVAGQLTL